MAVLILILNLIYIILKLKRLIQIFAILLIVGCSLTRSSNKTVKKAPHFLIFNQYGLDFTSFQNELDDFVQLANSIDPEDRSGELKDQFAVTRKAYKKIEFLFDYLEPNYAYLYVNGGPLPKLHKEVAEVDVIPPNGLQRLDELVFSDDLREEISEVRTRAKELQDAILFIKQSHLGDTISAQNAIESLRSGIVRVFTLGMTGFDTPGSGNAIDESLVSMKAMSQAFAFYGSDLSSNQKVVFDKILDSYQKGITQLSSADDFDNFDRFNFLKEVVNPLYEDLYAFQKSIGISTASLNVHAQNYDSQNLFDEEFLDRDYFTQFSYNDANNKDAIALGKTLFYDPILSKNMDMSCSTCHNPQKGFADGLAKSPTNRDGVFTRRNSPTLIDAAYSSKYFWDMREHDLEKQVAHVVEDSLEFNIGFKEIVKRLNQSETYLHMFDSAYGDISKSDINRRSISNAIASYVNTLTSFNSSFDQYVRGEIADYSDSAKKGFNLFMGKAACGTCHFAPAFNGSVPPFYTDAESEVLGVTMGYDANNPVMDRDIGRSQNGRRGDAHPHFDHSFKTVTVRNIALTAPYMHNGLFETLEDVIDFYNDGGGAGMGLDIENQTLASDSLNLSDLEKTQLIEFMQTLTDTTSLDPGKIVLPKFENQIYWNQRGKPKVIDD